MNAPVRADDKTASRIAALSKAQRALLARRLDALQAEHDERRPTTSGVRRGLVAHIVARAGHAPTSESLREHATQQLPAHMVPQHFVTVDALPRSAAGKLDRARLTLPADDHADTASGPHDAAGADTAPGSEAERILAGIWMEVLGVSEVGVDEDFFELGGDSLLSIRILSRANQQGLRISPEAFFSDPTIAAQARAADGAGGAARERGPVTGTLALTPIQHWFFERIPVHPHHWNQSFLFELRKPLGLSAIERAVQALLHHHDALRMQFDTAAMTARIVAPDSRLPVSHHDLRECPDDRLAADIDAIAVTLNASLDLYQAPLFRAALLETRPGLPDRLLLLAHHLLVDGLSWRILLEDLDAACAADEAGKPVRLALRTTSCKRWSEQLAEHAQDDEIRGELEHWRRVCSQPVALPLDMTAEAVCNLAGTAMTHRLALSADTSAALLRELPPVYRVGVDKLLLAALAVSLGRWRGPGPLRLDMEGHGREALFANLDISRTVGWFTSVFPLCLQLRADDPAAALTDIKTQASSIPNGGIGFGLLRELCEDPDVRSVLRAPVSQLLFNYLGQMGSIGGSGGRFALESSACGMPRAPDGLRAYVLEINAYVDDTRLLVDWSYSPAFHRQATVAALAGDFEQALGTLVGQARGGAVNTARPEDFPLAGLNQQELDSLADALGAMDDVPSPGDTR